MCYIDAEDPSNAQINTPNSSFSSFTAEDDSLPSFSFSFESSLNILSPVHILGKKFEALDIRCGGDFSIISSRQNVASLSIPERISPPLNPSTSQPLLSHTKRRLLPKEVLSYCRYGKLSELKTFINLNASKETFHIEDTDEFGVKRFFIPFYTSFCLLFIRIRRTRCC